MPITQMRRKHITVHPKVQFSLQYKCVKEIGGALEYLCAFPEPSADLDISCGFKEETLLILVC